MVDLMEVVNTNIVIFAHRDPDGTERVWNITSLMADPRVKRHTIRKIPIDPEYARFAMNRFGVERDNLAHLYLEDEEEDILEPILIANIDGDHLTIDGNHRYVLKAIKGKKWVYGKVLSKKIWADHLITGITKKQMDYLVDQKSSYLIDGDKFFE